MPLVLVTRALPDEWLAPLAGRCELRVGPADRAGIAPEIEPLLADADGLLCTLTERVDDALLDRMPQGLPAREIAERLLADVRGILDGTDPHDDITLVVLRVTEPAGVEEARAPEPVAAETA